MKQATSAKLNVNTKHFMLQCGIPAASAHTKFIQSKGMSSPIKKSPDIQRKREKHVKWYNSTAKIPHTIMNAKHMIIMNRIGVCTRSCHAGRSKGPCGITKVIERTACQVPTEDAVCTHYTQLDNTFKREIKLNESKVHK